MPFILRAQALAASTTCTFPNGRLTSRHEAQSTHAISMSTHTPTCHTHNSHPPTSCHPLVCPLLCTPRTHTSPTIMHTNQSPAHLQHTPLISYRTVLNTALLQHTSHTTPGKCAARSDPFINDCSRPGVCKHQTNTYHKRPRIHVKNVRGIVRHNTATAPMRQLAGKQTRQKLWVQHAATAPHLTSSYVHSC